LKNQQNGLTYVLHRPVELTTHSGQWLSWFRGGYSLILLKCWNCEVLGMVCFDVELGVFIAW